MSYTRDLPKDEVDSSIEKALNIWADYTPLEFNRIYKGEADIMVSFVTGGESLTLASAISILYPGKSTLSAFFT